MMAVFLVTIALGVLFAVLIQRTGGVRPYLDELMGLVRVLAGEPGGDRKRLSGPSPADVARMEHYALPERTREEWGHGNECVACRQAPVPPQPTIIPRNRRSTYDCQLHGHEYRLSSYDCIICGK